MNIESKNILLDVDGVVADFLNPACKAAGLDLESQPRGQWDVFRASGRDLKDVWDSFDNYEFWRNLPLIDGAPEFVATLRAKALSVTFLTSSSWSPDCVKAKREWVNEHFGFNSPMYVGCGGASKALCAKPNNVLIDDCPRNTDAFEAAGGLGVLVPRPWNRRHALGTCYHTVAYDWVLEQLGVSNG